ncbi:MAG: rhomboid family intramembrane serine protease [Gemmataceae bacterium]
MPSVHPFVAVLTILHRRHPTPWYYHEEPQADGHSFDDLRSVLEFLAQEGLVEKAPPRDERSGIGARLTPRGLAVLANPQAMQRLHGGESPFPNSISDTVRREFHRSITPWMTYLLMAISLGVYFYGVWLWYRLPRVPHDSGAVSGQHILEGDYLRLLTSTFYHGGGLHLLMNMLALWSLGSFVERVYGRVRYLLIYLLAAWGGTCTAMALNPFPVLGASGAVCGMLGALLIYMLILSRYLPRPQMRSLWFSLIVNILILTIISLFPGISGLGHLGGALAGALAALVLVWQRFGGWTGRFSAHWPCRCWQLARL